MKAKKIIQRLLDQNKLAEFLGIVEYYHDENGKANDSLIETMFGEYNSVLGTLEDNTSYMYQYSDQTECDLGEMPDAIVLLCDGRCILLYKLEG